MKTTAPTAQRGPLQRVSGLGVDVYDHRQRCNSEKHPRVSQLFDARSHDPSSCSSWSQTNYMVRICLDPPRQPASASQGRVDGPCQAVDCGLEAFRPRRSCDRADGSGMSRDTNPDDPEAKSSITGRAPTNIWPVGVHLEMAEQTQRTCAASSDARSRPRSTLYYPTAHPGVSVATPDRPTGLHLIRIIQGSILGLLGGPARRRDDVGSRPTAAGGLAMHRP